MSCGNTYSTHKHEDKCAYCTWTCTQVQGQSKCASTPPIPPQSPPHTLESSTTQTPIIHWSICYICQFMFRGRGREQHEYIGTCLIQSPVRPPHLHAIDRWMHYRGALQLHRYTSHYCCVTYINSATEVGCLRPVDSIRPATSQIQ